MKDTHFAEQKHADARTFPLADLRREAYKQRLYVGPAYRAVDRAGEDQFQRGSVMLFMEYPVSLFSTVFKINLSPSVGRSGVGAGQFIEQVAEPSLEHLNLGFHDRNGVGPVVGHGPFGEVGRSVGGPLRVRRRVWGFARRRAGGR